MAKVKKTSKTAGRAKKKAKAHSAKKVARKKAARSATKASKRTGKVKTKNAVGKKTVARAKSVVKSKTKKAAKKSAKKTTKPGRSKKVAPRKASSAASAIKSVAAPATTKSRKAITTKAKESNLRGKASKPSSNGRVEKSAADVPAIKPVPKTHLRPDELAEFRQLLLEKRAELAGDVQHLANESSSRNSEAGADHSTMPIHMADLGSDNWEHEFTLGLIANEQVRIREIDDALARIENSTYGVCVGTHKRIRKARLRAKPWAKYCIEYARAREEGRV